MKTRKKVIKMPSVVIMSRYRIRHPKREEEESARGYVIHSWQPMKIGGGW